MTLTNRLTLGNYIGALKNWVKLQEQYECFFMLGDLHTITERQDPKFLAESTYQGLAVYIAAGIDPDKMTLFAQSHVPQHAELAWVLNCFTYMGELNRMTQFKDKGAKHQNIPTGLFNYPVLMAADILAYDSHLVPVGDDQKQHLELTRDLAVRLNNIYGPDTLVVPEPYIAPVGARIMSFQDPESKMSKSDADENATVYILDTDEVILKKLKRAVTDSGTEVTYEDSKPGVKNMLTIQAALSGRKVDEIVASYKGKMYGNLKLETAAVISEHLGPIRDRAQALLKDKKSLNAILKRGAERAREKTSKTLKRLYDRIGFVERQS